MHRLPQNVSQCAHMLRMAQDHATLMQRVSYAWKAHTVHHAMRCASHKPCNAGLQNGAAMPHTRAARQAHTQFESLDYDLCDNTVYKADEALKGPADPLVYRAVKYSICGLIGVSIAITAFGVNFGVENIAGTRFWLLFTASRCGRHVPCLPKQA